MVLWPSLAWPLHEAAEEAPMAHKFIFDDGAEEGDEAGAPSFSRLIGGIGVAYVLVLTLLLVGGLVMRLHLDGVAAGAPVAPLGYRSAWLAFSA